MGSLGGNTVDLCLGGSVVVVFCFVLLCCVVFVVSCFVVSCFVVLCCVMLLYVMFCYIVLYPLCYIIKLRNILYILPYL